LLAQHEVERIIRQVEADHIPFLPCNRRTCWGGEHTGYGQHSWTYIERDHLPCRSNQGCDVSRYTARAARHIQRTFARLWSRVLKQHACPRVSDCGAKILLVRFGWIWTLLMAHGVLFADEMITAAELQVDLLDNAL
jgi:hypothetical protein